jgi:hypothetical protein
MPSGPAEPSRRAHSGVALLLLVFATVAAVGCMVREVQPSPPLDRSTRWVLLPLRNQTETPQAGERAESILSTLLRARGLTDLADYAAPGDATGELPELDERRRAARAVTWARTQGFAYAIAGSVEEWRYRNGLDGEPAVGLTLEILELHSGKVIWSASGARSGWGRDTLAGTAQHVLKSLLAELKLK